MSKPTADQLDRQAVELRQVLGSGRPSSPAMTRTGNGNVSSRTSSALPAVDERVDVLVDDGA